MCIINFIEIRNMKLLKNLFANIDQSKDKSFYEEMFLLFLF